MFHVTSDTTVEPGSHELRFEFEPTGPPDMTQGHGTPGRVQLYIDSGLVANAEIPYTTPIAINPGALTCGANPARRSHPTTRHHSRSPARSRR